MRFKFCIQRYGTLMGVGRRGQGGGRNPPGLSHMILLMCFSTSIRSVKTFQLSPTYHLRWLTLRAEVIKVKCGPG